MTSFFVSILSVERDTITLETNQFQVFPEAVAIDEGDDDSKAHEPETNVQTTSDGMNMYSDWKWDSSRCHHLETSSCFYSKRDLCRFTESVQSVDRFRSTLHCDCIQILDFWNSKLEPLAALRVSHIV